MGAGADLVGVGARAAMRVEARRAAPRAMAVGAAGGHAASGQQLGCVRVPVCNDAEPGRVMKSSILASVGFLAECAPSVYK